MVRDGLPNQITRKDEPPIHILKYPHDVKCIYTEVHDLVPELWSGRRSVYEVESKSNKKVSIDLMLHMGMHPDEGYMFEKRARREKYEYPGCDGRFLGKDALKAGKQTLFVEIDVENVVAKVMKTMPVCLSFIVSVVREALRWLAIAEWYRD